MKIRSLLASLFIVVFGLGITTTSDAGATSDQARISLPGGDALPDGNIASI